MRMPDDNSEKELVEEKFDPPRRIPLSAQVGNLYFRHGRLFEVYHIDWKENTVTWATYDGPVPWREE